MLFFVAYEYSKLDTLILQKLLFESSADIARRTREKNFHFCFFLLCISLMLSIVV